ncbi:MAG: hypothetical protein IPO06_27775 [Leptospiraceae bacterium]|nr:hypothetical protein [Leptospiraceae bacterium]
MTITGVNNDYLNPSGILYTITVPSPTSTDTSYNSLPTNTVNVKTTITTRRAIQSVKQKTLSLLILVSLILLPSA